MRTGMRIFGFTPNGSLPIGLIALSLGIVPLAASMANTPADANTSANEAISVETAAGPIETVPLTESASSQSTETGNDWPAATSLGSGSASYYASKFHGRRTASGEPFDNGAMTAAHRTLPFGSLVRVTNPDTGQSVTVRINDRGPFTRGRVIDVSRAAAEELGLVTRGHAEVELELIEG